MVKDVSIAVHTSGIDTRSTAGYAMQSRTWLGEVQANLVELKCLTYGKIIPQYRRYTNETTPLIDSRVERRQLHLLGHWRSWREITNRLCTACESHLQDFRSVKVRYLEALQSVWPFLWPKRTSSLYYRPILCEVVLALQCVLNWLFPNLLGTLTESLSLDSTSPRLWVHLTSTFACWFSKEHLCKWLRSWLWLDVAQLSQSTIQAKTVETTLNRPDREQEWKNGAFISDLNKGGSIIVCLEVVMFTWIPTFFYLFTTIVDLWRRLGITYGLIVTLIGLLYVCLIVYNAVNFVPYRRNEVERKRERAAIITHMLNLVVDIGLQNGSEVELAHFEQAQAEYQDRVRESSRVLISQGFFPNMIFLVGFFIMAICIMQHPENRVRSFTIIITHMVELQRELQCVADSVEEFSSAVVNSERIIGVLKYQTRIREEKEKEMAAAPAEISFESISLASLERLTFLCKVGTTTICPGIPEHGRDQLLRILARFEEPQLGIIRVNAFDIRAYSTKSVRRNVGFISQEYRLLGVTVIQCLTYGLENPGSIDREKLIAACKAVNIHDLILDRLGSYDAPVSRDSCTLKREERRRFGLVTAIVGNRGILILDGAITALESETVQRLKDAVKAATDGRTVIVLE